MEMPNGLNTAITTHRFEPTRAIERHNKNGKFLGTTHMLGVENKSQKEICEELKAADPSLSNRAAKKLANETVGGETEFRIAGAMCHILRAVKDGFPPEKAEYSTKGKLTIRSADVGTNVLGTTAIFRSIETLSREERAEIQARLIKRDAEEAVKTLDVETVEA